MFGIFYRIPIDKHSRMNEQAFAHWPSGFQSCWLSCRNVEPMRITFFIDTEGRLNMLVV